MTFAKVFFGVALCCGIAMPAVAQQQDAPASPSGAPKAAAENGSSEAGKAGAKNEMSSHQDNSGKQDKMADPHKQ